jgi:hypothetical protein
VHFGQFKNAFAAQKGDFAMEETRMKVAASQQT